MISKKMHILIIPSEHFITKTQPLGGIFQYHQAKTLSNAGHQIGVLSVGYITPRYLISKYIYKKEEKIDNINIKRDYKQLYFPHRYMPFKILKNNYIKMADKLYSEYIKEFGMPDIIHAHNFLYAGVVAEFLKNKYGIKYIVTEHSSSFARNNLSHEKIKSIEDVAKNASKVTAVSSSFNNILKEYMQKAKAFVFAAEEDFGIMPVEAQACGTPVICLGRGGTRETVIDMQTGVHFMEQSVESLIEAIDKFEKNIDKFDPKVIRKNALRFSRDRFEKEIKEFVEEKYQIFISGEKND